MKHFLPVNIGDTERVLELICVSKEEVLHTASLIGTLLCVCKGDRYHQGKAVGQSDPCQVCVPTVPWEGLRCTVLWRFTHKPSL